MKKLMTVLASAATALFAIGVAKGDGFVAQGINFEPNEQGQGYSAGDVFDAQKNDLGGTDGSKFWYSTAHAGEIGDISNSTASVGKALVPDFFNPNEANSLPIGNYLHIDTSAPLFRSAVANDQSGAFTAVDIGDGIYLDTLVQFTAADDAFQADLDTGDKIAISYVEHEDDLTTGENEAWTNFVIRAGAMVDVEGKEQKQFGQENYFATVPAGFNKDEWHRLTVRTIKNVGDGQVGFVIYLDGDMTQTLKFTNNVETGFDEESLSPLAKSFYKVNALYPSAVASAATGGTTISAASFSGTGALDDVVFTAAKPGFITEQASVTIAWTEGVATVKIGNAEAIACTGAGSTVVDLPANGTVLVTATFAEGYEAGTYTVAPPGAQGSWDSTTGGFVNLADGNVCTIVAVQPKFDVAGVHYEKFEGENGALAAAIAAGTEQQPAVIALLANVDNSVQVTGGYIVIDLAGKTITDGGKDGYAIYNDGASLLVITNSTAEIGHVVATTGAAIAINDATTVIAGGSIDGVVDGAATPYLKLTGGLFYDDEYDEDEPGDFYLLTWVVGKAEYVGEQYFQVSEGGDQPTTLTLTITDNANAEYSVTINDEAAETGAEIEADDVIVITATAKSGYEYATAPEGWTLSEGVITKSITVVDASVAVTIPAPTAVVVGTYTVTVTPTANATYTAAYKSDETAITPENDVLTVTVGQTIVITATPKSGYEYAEEPTGWTLSEGVITIEVSAAGTVAIPAPTAQQQGGYPTYIDTTDADAKAKYDAWKATYGDDTASAYEDAFLLNCAPADVNTEKAAFKFTKIAFEGGVWVVETTTKNTDGADYNGTVTIKRYSDVGCTSENENGSFFKAVLK